MEENTRKQREVESAEKRARRLDSEGQQKRDEQAVNDKRVDDMISQNVKLHGG